MCEIAKKLKLETLLQWNKVQILYNIFGHPVGESSLLIIQFFPRIVDFDSNFVRKYIWVSFDHNLSNRKPNSLVKKNIFLKANKSNLI
jgi:hypothetical protein